jgi:hypothetical protein
MARRVRVLEPLDEPEQEYAPPTRPNIDLIPPGIDPRAFVWRHPADWSMADRRRLADYIAQKLKAGRWSDIKARNPAPWWLFGDDDEGSRDE